MLQQYQNKKFSGSSDVVDTLFSLFRQHYPLLKVFTLCVYLAVFVHHRGRSSMTLNISNNSYISAAYVKMNCTNRLFEKMCFSELFIIFKLVFSQLGSLSREIFQLFSPFSIKLSYIFNPATTVSVTKTSFKNTGWHIYS